MYTTVNLLVLFSLIKIKDIKSMTVPKTTFLLDKSGPESEIADFIYSKGYLPPEKELSKPAVVKSVENDVTYLLSKMSDTELIKLLNDQPKKNSYNLNDIVKISLGGKYHKDHKHWDQNMHDDVNLQNLYTPDKRFHIISGGENDQKAYFKLNQKPILPKKQNNEINFLALKKLHSLLNYHPVYDVGDLTEKNKEQLFDVLVSQLKTLCCKSNKQSYNMKNLQVDSTIPFNVNDKSHVKESSQNQKSDEFMFLIVNDEIKSKSNDDLIQVDPETLEKNSSILLLGPITSPLTDDQLKAVMDRISNELSKPEYSALLQQLSDGTLNDNNISLMKNFIFGHDTRRYIKPHRCNYQSKLAKIYGGPRWLICTGYLNLNKPSLYD